MFLPYSSHILIKLKKSFLFHDGKPSSRSFVNSSLSSLVYSAGGSLPSLVQSSGFDLYLSQRFSLASSSSNLELLKNWWSKPPPTCCFQPLYCFFLTAASFFGYGCGFISGCYGLLSLLGKIRLKSGEIKVFGAGMGCPFSSRFVSLSMSNFLYLVESSSILDMNKEFKLLNLSFIDLSFWLNSSVFFNDY